MLVVALATGCTSGEDMKDPAGSTPEPGAAGWPTPSGGSTPSGKPKTLVMPNGDAVTAPPAQFAEMPVLVTFVGGPANGRTESLPLSRLKETIVVDGVAYRTRPGIPPEVDPDRGAQVFRPVG
ncbi:hypothetical protein [Embleya sp. NPDC020630]|uniref:hypothetical protein n=1 Tax=Embleya sp. NPDC020630 TaxID=3363979 RepID=UPI00379D9DD9